MHDDDTLLADLRPVRRALSSQGGALFDLSAQTGSRSSGRLGRRRLPLSAGQIQPRPRGAVTARPLPSLADGRLSSNLL